MREEAVIDTDACWIWPGSVRAQDGRALISRRYAYRLVYEAATGRKLGLSDPLHHTCETPSCINPWHLAETTSSEHATHHLTGRNVKRGAERTHCKNGHLLSADNVMIVHSARDGDYRRCRICSLAAQARNRAKNIVRDVEGR